MTTKKNALLTLLVASFAMPALAADPAQSGIAGDPTWPYTPQVAPAIVLHQAVVSEAGLDRDPTWPGAVAIAPGMVLHQEPLFDDPLQGNADLAGQYHASRSGMEKARRTACLAACACARG